VTLQNNPDLILDIKKVGCLFLTLIRIAELESNTELSVHNINYIWNISKRKHYIDNNNTMNNPDGVLREAFFILQRPTIVISQVGIEKQGKKVYWQWARNKYEDYKYKIEKVATLGKIGTHFRLCNKNSELIYDSYSWTNYSHKKLHEYTLYSILRG